MGEMDDGDFRRKRGESVGESEDSWNDGRRSPTEADRDVDPDSDPEREVQLSTSRPWMVYLLLGLNVLVYLAIVVKAGNLNLNPNGWVLEWGWYGPRGVTEEVWRILTFQFVNPHPPMVIIVYTCLLASLGRTLEQSCGAAFLLVTYLLCGATGAVTSYWVDTSVFGTGAGWSIIGILAAAAGHAVGCRALIPREQRVKLIVSVLVTIGLNAYLAGNARAHLVAVVAASVVGFLVGLFVGWNPFHTHLAKNYKVFSVALVGSLLIALGLRLAPPPPADFFKLMDEFTQIEKGCIERFNGLVPQLNGPPLEADRAAAIVRREVIPEWKRGAELLREASQLSLADPVVLESLRGYMAMRLEGLQQLMDGIEQRNLDQQREGAAKFQKAEGLLQKP